MIFGFNSDIQHGDTVYHVQSEVRRTERVLETLVFVGGRCVGKRATPIPDTEAPSEGAIHEMLKAQHRWVLEVIRKGRVGSLPTEPQLTLDWLSAKARPEEDLIALRFRVNPTPARVSACWERSNCPPAYVEAEVSADGTVALALPLDRAVVDAAVTVQAKTEAGSITRRFRWRRK
jgi:hypothetical protein